MSKMKTPVKNDTVTIIHCFFIGVCLALSLYSLYNTYDLEIKYINLKNEQQEIRKVLFKYYEAIERNKESIEKIKGGQ